MEKQTVDLGLCSAVWNLPVLISVFEYFPISVTVHIWEVTLQQKKNSKHPVIHSFWKCAADFPIFEAVGRLKNFPVEQGIFCVQL